MTNFIGIDFGTTTCAMSWVPPGRDFPAIIRNAEGDETTPSILFYGADPEPLVGEVAADMASDEAEWTRVIHGIKRDLLKAAPIRIGTRRIQPVEAAAAILAKLREDAQRGIFRDQPLPHAVITHPAFFDPLQRDKLRDAAALAGFTEVVLLSEPVAAALAYERWLTQAGSPVAPGDHILVYDFGGGTFDLAVLVRDEDGSFREALPPSGLAQRGGNDLDLALYDHLEQEALARLQRGFGDGRSLHLPTLQLCREWKERLTTAPQVSATAWLPEDGELPPVRFSHVLERAEFEELIDAEFIEPTIRLTKSTWERAVALAGDSAKVKLVLIGGATRVPLVERRLREALPVTPHAWDQRDLAVALGAAWHGRSVWGNERAAETPPPAPIVPSPPTPTPTPEADRQGSAAPPEPAAELTLAPAIEPETEPVSSPPDPTPSPTIEPSRMPVADPIPAQVAWDIVVDPSGNGDFTTIPAAIAAAASESTILVRKGTYTGGIKLDKPVQIIGDGKPGDVVLEHHGGTVVTSTAASGLLRNLHIQQTGGEEGHGIDIAAGDLVVEQCDIVSLSEACVFVGGDANPTIRSNRIHGGAAAGIWVYDEGTGILEDNDIFGNDEDGIWISSSENPTVQRNRIHENQGFGVSVEGEGSTGTIEDNDIFANGFSGVLIRSDGDPAVRANRINRNGDYGLLVQESGGTFVDNDLTGNSNGAWSVDETSRDRIRQRGNITNGPAPPSRTASVADPTPPASSDGDIVVDESGDGDFTDIQEAIAAAAPGDTILIREGTYTGGIKLDKPLRIIGESEPGEVVLERHGGDVIISTAASGLLRNLYVRQTGGVHDRGIYIRTGELVVEQCDIVSLSGPCISIAEDAHPTIRNNRIHGGADDGISVYNGKGTIEDNDIYANVGCGVSMWSGSDSVVRKNRIHDNQRSGITVYESKGTIEDNDIFANSSYGVSISNKSKLNVRANRINRNFYGINVERNAGGVIENNDLRDNRHEALNIAMFNRGKVKQSGNRE